MKSWAREAKQWTVEESLYFVPPRPSATPQFPAAFASVQCPWATTFNDELFRKPPHRFPAGDADADAPTDSARVGPLKPAVVSARDVLQGSAAAQAVDPPGGKRHFDVPGTGEVRDTLRLPASLGLPLRAEARGLGALQKVNRTEYTTEVYRAGYQLRAAEKAELKQRSSAGHGNVITWKAAAQPRDGARAVGKRMGYEAAGAHHDIT